MPEWLRIFQTRHATDLMQIQAVRESQDMAWNTNRLFLSMENAQKHVEASLHRANVQSEYVPQCDFRVLPHDVRSFPRVDSLTTNCQAMVCCALSKFDGNYFRAALI